jgi:predicted PurR-regulated permease PerM
MHEPGAGPHVYSSQTPAAGAGDARRESCHILVHTGDPMKGSFAALRPRGLTGGLISLAAAIALLYYGQLFLVTVFTAVIINFILEPFVGLLVRVRVPRALASFIVCSFAVCGVYFAGLGVYRQGSRLVEDVPKYAQRIGDLSNGVVTKLESMEHAANAMVAPKRLGQSAQRSQSAKRGSTPEPVMPVAPAPGVQEVHIQPERPPLLEFIHSHLGSLYETLMMASFVPFLVYFMLSWRDQIQPAFLQLFEGPGRIAAATSLDGIASMVRAFVVGNFLLGLLLGIASTVFFWAFRLPYPVLIGPLSGFLSLVPSVGVPLALAPPLLAALTVYSTPAPYVIIVAVVALIHLLTMNLLYPKIVGQRVHLNPLVVAVALMFWSALWGAAGMILAIPLTAGIKAVCDHVKSLERYGRLLGD